MHPISYLGLPAATGMSDWYESMSCTLIRSGWLLSRPRARPNLQRVGLSHAWFPPPPVRLRHSPCTRESRVGPALAADLKKGEANEITTVSQPGTSRLLPRQERQHDRTSVVLLSGAGTGRNGAEPVRKHLVQSAVHAQARLRYIGAQLPHDASQV